MTRKPKECRPPGECPEVAVPVRVRHTVGVQESESGRRFWVGALWSLVVALGLLVLWFLITGLLGALAANSIQNQAAAVSQALRDGDTEAAVSEIAALRDSAATADARFNSAPWSWAADFPVVGPTVALVGAIAEGSNAVAASTEGADEQISAAIQQIQDDGAEGLVGLGELAPVADAAAEAVKPSQALVASIRPSDLSGPGEELQAEFLDTAAGVEVAAGAARALPVMLGAEGDRRWMVLVQNTAEARGTGGLIGAYSIVDVRDGRFKPQSAQTTNELFKTQTIPLAGIPKDTREFWGASLSKWWGLNLDRNFPFAGQLSARGIAAVESSVDDIVSLDARAVAGLLKVTGPVSDSGVTVDSQNAADFFTKDIYKEFPNPDKKDEVTIALTEKMLQKIAAQPLDVFALIEALGPAAQDGRVLTYSTDVAVQESLERMPTAGLVPDTPGPWATVAINDLAGSKMDAYWDTGVIYESASRCEAPGGTSKISVTVQNNAPTGLPSYVDIRADGGGEPGSTKIGIAAYAPVGAELLAYSLDDEVVPLDTGVSRNHPAWQAAVELQRGQTRTFVVEFTEPFEPGLRAQFSAQPMTNDMAVAVVTPQDCG